MITRDEIKARVQKLAKGEVALFSTDEIGKPYPCGIFVERNMNQLDYPLYTVDQMGDFLGDRNSLSDVIETVCRAAGI